MKYLGECSKTKLLLERTNYRPQRSLRKLCFTGVCLSTGGEPGQVLPWAGTHPTGRYTPPGMYTPWPGTHPGRYTPRQVPPGRYTPWTGTPLGRYTTQPQCMLGYGQQADGMHPTGMHSCLTAVLINHFMHEIRNN